MTIHQQILDTWVARGCDGDRIVDDCNEDGYTDLISLAMAAQRETDALIVEAQEGITLITEEHDNVGDEWVKQLNIAAAIRAGAKMKSAEEILDFWFKPTLRTGLGYDGPTLLGLTVCSMAEQREIDALIVEAQVRCDPSSEGLMCEDKRGYWVMQSSAAKAIRAGE